MDENHFWPGKFYKYNGYVDVIVAGKKNPENNLRPNILLQRYINEIDRLNKVLFIFLNLILK